MATAALTPDQLKRVHAAVDREDDRRAKLVEDLERLASAAETALSAARAGKLHYSWQGYRLYNAIHDVTGCEAIYDVRNEIGRELGIDSDGERILYLDKRS